MDSEPQPLLNLSPWTQPIDHCRAVALNPNSFWAPHSCYGPFTRHTWDINFQIVIDMMFYAYTTSIWNPTITKLEMTSGSGASGTAGVVGEYSDISEGLAGPFIAAGPYRACFKFAGPGVRVTPLALAGPRRFWPGLGGPAAPPGPAGGRRTHLPCPTAALIICR